MFNANESAEVDVVIAEVEMSSIEVEISDSVVLFHWGSAVQTWVKAEIVFCWNLFKDKTRSNGSVRASHVGERPSVLVDTVEIG